MRLTADLIHSSLSYLNPLKERELDLRGHKIPAIENLGVAGDQDAIDLTDNDITILTNFPLSPRLHMLLLARNRVAHVAPSLPTALPNLTTLVLTANHVAELGDLDPLAGFPKLTHLILLENPVTRREHYRHYLIWKCPRLRFLDYQKVRDVERSRAVELFGTVAEPTELVSKLTTEERARVEEMIRNAKSLQEIARLERDLNEGRVPGGISGGEKERGKGKKKRRGEEDAMEE
ncbi:MAG: U2 snRNP complex subunit [Thelocarpon superellum]|nr:MAG: U2 snRNP complex subunit [Thelocarpon superellum]